MSSKMTVQVYGSKYNITTTENPAYVQGLVQEIDKLVTSHMHSGGISINQALLLASMNYLDIYKKSEDGTDNLRRQITEYADDAAKARMELADARKELQKLKAKNKGAANG